ncbi:MAG: LacI family DNA-binding transcriptional regulator, partial [Chitinophagaceae bacterium]
MPGKSPTIKEIARQLGISPSAVSRALHGHPSIGLKTRKLVQDLAQKLNYVPNQTALYFKAGKTKTLGVILPYLGEDFFSKAISGLEDVAMNNGYTVLIGQSRDSMERERQIVSTMVKHRVDGLIVSVAKDTDNFTHFKDLGNYHIPAVFFDRVPDMENISFVRCNLKKGAEEAMDLLILRGHTRIGLLNGPPTLAASLEREEGYAKALDNHHIAIDPDLIKHSSLDAESTELAMKGLLSVKNKPTAILIFNDYVALDAIRYMKSQQLIINKDVSMVSFANISMNHYLNDSPLASVEQFPARQGQ